MTPWSKFSIPQITAENRGDGATILRADGPLGPFDRCMGDVLARQADARPDTVFLADRGPDGAWRKVTYKEAYALARSIGQALLDRGLSQERPVLIVSENRIEFALLGLGAAFVGVPFAPVSAAYARPGQGFGKLEHVAQTVAPGVILVDSWDRFAAAREVLEATGAEIVVAGDLPADAGVTPFDTLTASEASGAVDAAAAAVDPDDVLKILFTSGSTGLPKGVMNTHRMICANQAMIIDVWPFLSERPPVLLDWLPWSHTFGGNYDFNTVLWNGGTYYIDAGKPAPGLIETTIANLRDVTPTMLLNVPAGFGLLMDYLEKDEDLAARVLGDLDLFLYAAAAMPDPIQTRIKKLAEKVTGREIPLVSAWGTTETAPLSTSMNFPTTVSGNIGLPVRGVEVKLTPVGDKLEIRVRGPNITPGYWRNPEATEKAFDDEGFYCSGDAVKLVDPDDPMAGLQFDGRIAENFKLVTGTWVHVGALRLALIAACAPVAQDCVITGHNREEIGALVFPNVAGCRSLCPDLPADAPVSDILDDPRVRAALADGLMRLSDQGGGSSMRVTRAMLVAEMPTIEAGEITDKGYINQGAVLSHRAELVERLHTEGDDAAIIRLRREPAE